MTVEKNFKLLPRVSPPDLTTQIIAGIMKPIYTVRQALALLKLPTELSVLKGKYNVQSKERKALVSNKYNSKDIMRKCKENRCSFNDAMQSILG